MDKYGRRKLAKNQSSVVKSPNEIALDENERNLYENERETQRVSDDIARAKREGNVAHEEKLKVQLARLADERTKLDSLRREMKREEEERQRQEYEPPSSPQYSSIFTPEGSPDEQQAEEVRRAVGSFNAKMLEKYGDNDENIPESDGFSPRTPSSPAYSSIFEGGSSGSGSQRGGSGGKFIPQIPTSVLDHYLNSKYGVSSKHTTNVNMSGMMMGGGGDAVAVGGLPTMNIPVVATMPMAGMMPVQTQGGGGGGGVAVGTNGLQQQQQQQGGQPSSNVQTSGTSQQTNEPNAQGVKTFSIKL